ncbi:hypothetical protein P22_0287 [Propionispora sp. 2/2-37]|uniref:peptidoglycan D,D-transpeptidase FtsI family protein n=1 Tax=Propionispora sp. 2/2-37 TaxID=1677858 RepID=UPI0006BB6744|nr:penicillin-binding transpeptidase domain-containing protein [Propionispora sp. 2/2-37]CUH94221.1 hypothetical protein P22_0287 [Propionispora sp. 2/2-37]
MRLNRISELHNTLSENIRTAAYVIIGMLCVVFIYVSYLQTVKSSFLAEHPLNQRITEANKKIHPGEIRDRHNEKLAYSEEDGKGSFRRYYPYGALTAHVVGYNSKQYGKTGVEAVYGAYLSGTQSPFSHWGAISQAFRPEQGANVILTIDTALQETAYNALGNYRGAVVALNPHTGEILAMASKPGFNPNTIDENGQDIFQSPDGLLINRATQGLYPPGSTLKVMMAEAALKENIANLDTVFSCQGTLQIGKDYTLTEADGSRHGDINLEKALAVSCNITFGTLALNLGNKRMEKTFERYGFTTPLNSDFQESLSHLPDFADLSSGDLAQTGIGQGSFLTTPLRMALLASAFANRGGIMKPYLVSQVQDANGNMIEKNAPTEWLTPIDAGLAEKIKEMMITVVSEGTGSAAALKDALVAGKTGTAENPHGKPHAWFIGFAPADNPQIVVAVIVENAGSGGQVAAPIARQVLAQGIH